MTLVPHHLPDYVERGGGLVYRPPYTARQAVLDGFVVKADQAAIDALLQHDLVAPTGGAVAYQAVHDHVIVAFTRIGELASVDATDRQRGCMSELEVSVWCLVADVHAGDRLCWYLPYVFTDSPQTMATGREVYGYPKQTGTFSGGAPLGLPPGGRAAVDALCIDPFGPYETAVSRPIIAVERSATASGPLVPMPPEATLLDEVERLFPGPLSVSATFSTGPTAAKLKITPPGQQPPSNPKPPWAGKPPLTSFATASFGAPKPSLVASLVADPTLVFLKQFRDVTCPTKACYQAVIEAPLQLDFVGASYHAYAADDLTVEIADWASHPIARDLGTTSGAPLTVERAFRAEFGFDTLLGEELWRRP